jgi:hypothetical protein
MMSFTPNPTNQPPGFSVVRYSCCHCRLDPLDADKATWNQISTWIEKHKVCAERAEAKWPTRKP